MNRAFIPAALVIMLTTSTVLAAEPSDGNAEIAAFIKQHLLGKTFTRESKDAIDNGRVESSIKHSVKFVGLVQSDRGIEVDRLTTIVQTMRDLDADGRPSGEARRKDRVVVLRYYLGARKSTGELMGYATTVVSSSPDAFPYSATAVRAELKKDRLVLHEDSVLYEDLFAKGGKFRPGAVTTTMSFEPKANGVELTSKTVGFDVDPKTMARTISDDLPVSISRESTE